MLPVPPPDPPDPPEPLELLVPPPPEDEVLPLQPLNTSASKVSSIPELREDAGIAKFSTPKRETLLAGSDTVACLEPAAMRMLQHFFSDQLMVAEVMRSSFGKFLSRYSLPSAVIEP